MPYFSARPGIFAAPVVERLDAWTTQLLEAAAGEKTVLAAHLADPASREAAFGISRAFYDSPLPSIFAERHGIEPALNLSNTAIRRHAAVDAGTFIDWHMDLNFTLDDAPFLVCWTPLQDVGEIRGGLEVCVPAPGTSMVPLFDLWARRTAARQRPVFDDAVLEETLGPGAFSRRPLKLRAGDGAVFDQFVLHRTQRLVTATEGRVSVEFRMVDLNRLPRAFDTSDGIFCRPEDRGDGLRVYLSRRKRLSIVAPEALDRLQVAVG